MAFISLDLAKLAAGQPVKTELWTQTKDNQDDHETRITANETAVQTFEPLKFALVGPVPIAPAILTQRIHVAITVTNARILVVTAGTAGTLECDLLKSTGGAFSTIFSTRPSVAFGAGDLSLSVDQVLSTTEFAAGDFLQVEVVSTQTAIEEAVVFLEYEVT